MGRGGEGRGGEGRRERISRKENRQERKARHYRQKKFHNSLMISGLEKCLIFSKQPQWLDSMTVISNNFSGLEMYMYMYMCTQNVHIHTLVCTVVALVCTALITKFTYMYICMRKGLGIYLENCENRQPPGIERGPLTLVVSALPPELWPPGDSQPSQFSISLCMCHQNATRDRPVTPLHQGRSHTE